MRLPVIRALTEFIEKNDETQVQSAVEVLEHLAQVRGLKDEELDLIGELISNLCGSVEVAQMIKEGKPQSEALNEFMKRVLGSIDKN